MDKIPTTQEGYNALEAELKKLKTVDRPTVIEAIATAREHGDLSENAEYHAAREQQSFIEGRIQELEAVISKAQIIDVSSLSGSSVKFGARVLIVDEDTDVEVTYQIVGHYEANADEGKLSVQAPISRALIGKEVGDSVEVQTPQGKKSYEILEVMYGEG
ncbi:MAG: transcription elongation factor GreA [Rhodospirillales bacterium]|nr:transcription elongation factor GreA [Rhodospirillales bacterium]MCB9996045.1 transcription elongation factor GreA [Rhodospirillales bacterium]